MTTITLTNDESTLVRGVFIRNVLHPAVEAFNNAVSSGGYHDPDVEAVDREWANLVEVMEADAAITAGGEVTLDDAMWDHVVPEGRDYLISTVLPEGPGTDESVRQGVDQLQHWVAVGDKLKAARGERGDEPPTSAVASVDGDDEAVSTDIDTPGVILSRIEAEALWERINGYTVSGGLASDVYDLVPILDLGRQLAEADVDAEDDAERPDEVTLYCSDLAAVMRYLKDAFRYNAQYRNDAIWRIVHGPDHDLGAMEWASEMEEQLSIVEDTSSHGDGLARAAAKFSAARVDEIKRSDEERFPLYDGERPLSREERRAAYRMFLREAPDAEVD